MLEIDKAYLVNELNQVLTGLNEQIHQVHQMAVDNESDAHRLRTTNGGLLLSPLLVAKTDVLVALTKLQE